MRGRYTVWAVLVVVVAAALIVGGATSARSVDLKEGVVLEGGAMRDVAETVWFQGFLADYPSGDPVNATYNVLARIFAVPSGGGALWGPETHNGTTITQGWFNIELGSNIGSLPDFASPPYYLELIVDGEILAPRLKLGSVPTALRSGDSDGGGQWYETNRGIAYADTVSIGTSWPQELFTIHPTGFGEDGFIHFSPYVIVDGEKDGSRLGEGAVLGILDNDPNFYMVNAEEGGWLFMGAADYPTVAVTESTKVVMSPYAIMGWEPPGYLTVDGDDIGSYGAAIYSSRNDDATEVVHAEYYGDAQYPTAVYGDATGNDEWGTGGEFRGNGYGVQAYAQGDGSAAFMYGVYGNVNNTGGTATCYSVYGAQPAGNGTKYAGYFNGNVSVTGTLSKGAGAFKIDHPLDPTNMYLQHSFVESPDMMNVYNGNVVLDGAGEATVALPDYFEVLNRDFRYQLTAIGAPGPNLYIASEIEGNSFRIAGGVPGSKVSWQVTGVRQDRYAEENRIAVEVQKEGYEVGRYAHPEAYGLPTTMSVEYHEEIEAARAAKAATVAERKARDAARREQARAATVGEGLWRSK